MVQSLPPCLFLAAGLSLIPLVTGIFVQTIKGFHQYNFLVYITYLFVILLPALLEMVLFAYAVHVLVNNKFVAHGIAVFVWVAIFFLRQSGIFNYNLLLLLLYALVRYFGYGRAGPHDKAGKLVRPVLVTGGWFTYNCIGLVLLPGRYLLL